MQYKAILVSLFAVAAMAAPARPEFKDTKAVASHGVHHSVPIASGNGNGNGKDNANGNKIANGLGGNHVANGLGAGAGSENFKGNDIDVIDFDYETNSRRITQDVVAALKDLTFTCVPSRSKTGALSCAWKS